MKISLVVPAFNEERLLPASLASIQAATAEFGAAGWEVELIVCDNNSTDRTPEIAAAAGARVVFEPVNQISRARNAGAAHATGNWLLFIDADSFPTRELFADVVAAISTDGFHHEAAKTDRARQDRDGLNFFLRGLAAIVHRSSRSLRLKPCVAGGSTLRFDTDDRAARFLIEWWNLHSRLFKWAAGSFIFCEAAAFREIGGFTTKLYAAEEIDLFRRLKRFARQQGRSVVILHRHPLLTSGRKGDLYTPREMLLFWTRTILSGGGTLRSSARAFPWYDGRR